MENVAQDIIQSLSKMDLTSSIAQKSCLMSDLKLIHILLYIKNKIIQVISEGGLPENGRLMDNCKFFTLYRI